MTGQRVRGGMWCPVHGPVAAIRNTHGLRNVAGVAGIPYTAGLSLLVTKVEPYVCPHCGRLVSRSAPKGAAASTVAPMGDGEYAVTLVAAGDRKTIAAIKAVREQTRWDLKMAKSAVDHVPCTFEGLTEDGAGQLHAALEAVGATVELHPPEPAAGADEPAADELRAAGPVAVEHAETLTTELERLHRLHTAGGLTDAEYAAAKQQLLET